MGRRGGNRDVARVGTRGSRPVAADGRRRCAAREREGPRIVEAMRMSVAEVGISGSTFDRVAAKAGVSRGLLHYYFGTKERLLVEVIRRDTEYRIDALGSAMRSAESVDEIIAAFVGTFAARSSGSAATSTWSPSCSSPSRNKPEIRDELGALYARARSEIAEILREKEREGVSTSASRRVDAHTHVRDERRRRDPGPRGPDPRQHRLGADLPRGLPVPARLELTTFARLLRSTSEGGRVSANTGPPGRRTRHSRRRWGGTTRRSGPRGR